MGSGAGAEEWSSAVAGKELDTSGASDDGSGCESDGEQSRLLPPKKRPRGPGDLLLRGRVHFVPASAAGPSNHRHHYPRHEQNWVYNRAPSAMSSFAAPNSAVANMMRLMNYEAGAGLGKHGQGIISPVKATQRPPLRGFGTVGAERGGSYDNGLPDTDPEAWPDNWEDDRGENRSYHQIFEQGDADGSRKQGREFCEEIIAKLCKQRDATLTRLDEAILELVVLVIVDAMAVITNTSRTTVSTRELTAGDLIWGFTWLKENSPEEYRMYRLADTTRVVLAPLVRPVLQRWQPLLDPTVWLGVVALLKNTMDDGSATSPYAALINDAVVPAVKVSEWKATAPDGMLGFLTRWEDMLSPSTMQRILEEVVMPKLTAEVDSWDPRCKWLSNSFCHSVLYPWVPLAGPLLEGLFATVIRKLREGLEEWDAGCALTSNYKLVSPWKALFGPPRWELFVDEIDVIPRLRQALREIQITPPKQKDGSFGEVIMKWAPLVRRDDMVQLLEAEFFHRWLCALRHWVRSARPPAREAMEWCRGWKRLFTPELLADERVLAQLQIGVGTVSPVAQGLEI